MIPVKITEETLSNNLFFDTPIKYNDAITISPVKVRDYFMFHWYLQSITVRKNSRYPDKKIIKMSYLDFLVFAKDNEEFANQYKDKQLSFLYDYVLGLLQLVCIDHEIQYNTATMEIYINRFLINSDVFDDIRRIILLQNYVDFDIDEFINYDTERALENAANRDSKNKLDRSMEDIIDSLCVVLHMSASEVGDLSLRKFWRYIHRIDLRDLYLLQMNGEFSGMSKFKSPPAHWTSSIKRGDTYSNVKTDEDDLKSKIG